MNGARANRDMITHLDVALPVLSGLDAPHLAGFRVGHPMKVLGQMREELAVHLLELAFFRDLLKRDVAAVDPRLDLDVRARLALAVAPVMIFAEVVIERALDVDRQRDMAFDPVAVITVHRPDYPRERSPHSNRNLSSKAARSVEKLRC